MNGHERPRVGLFGGTFDPPHRGHLSVARDVAEALELDRVIWIPAGRPPHKSRDDLTPAEHRLAMASAAVADEPRFEVSRCELDRAGPSYTVDTVRELSRELGDAELFVIIGADQLRALDGWRDPDGILERAKLAVMDRAGERTREARGPALDRAGPDRVVHVPITRIDVSSSEVRGALSRGDDPGDAVPPAVMGVIRDLGLYRPEGTDG